MPSRANASRAFARHRLIAELWMADVTAAVVLVVQQRNRHRMAASLKPQFKSFVAHCFSLSQCAFSFHTVPPVPIKL
jgi:hypothetical protein